jgi:hypothetical protein
MLLLRLWNLSGFAVMMTLAGFAAAAIFVLLAFNRVPLGYNFRNLTVRWKTTLLTALAFTLVIALLTVMQAFVNGMRKLTENSGRPDNLLVLSDGAPDEAISNLAVGDLSELEHLPQVLRRGARPFASRETFIVANQAVEVAGAAQPLRRPKSTTCGCCPAAVGSRRRACGSCPNPRKAPPRPRPSSAWWARAWPANSAATAPAPSAPKPATATASMSATRFRWATAPG